MEKIKLNRNMKLFIVVIIAVSIGSFFTDILYRTGLNIWLARGVGCGICVGIGLLLTRLWLKDDK